MSPPLLEDTLRLLVATGAGFDAGYCIPGNDDGARPSGEYASLLEVDDLPRHLPENTEYNGQATISMVKRATYSLQFYRGDKSDPSEAAGDFVAWAHSITGLDAVEEAGEIIGIPFVIVQPFGSRRLDVPVGDGWEHRAVIDLEVDYIDTRTETVPTIASRSGTITLSTVGADIEESYDDG